MIDGHNTTVDWQLHPGRVAAIAVGAFEQHGDCLPLDTDAIEGDYFARLVAEDLGAALLPTLRFGTSLEQTGFRGTLTLRPETLMQVVRDVAGELERQGFTRLVLVNAHGGNHCLVPAVRDINRLDRPLKIVMVNFWDFSDPGLACDSRCHGHEIHAGEWEVSLMLAIAPDLVRSPQQGRGMPVRQGEAHPLRQSDLTMFGVGEFAPAGAVGWPAYASAEKGRAIVESIRRNLLPHVRDRLARLDANPRYAGRGGIAVRPMLSADIPDGMRLKTAAGWNQREGDWRLILEAGLDSSFVAVANGSVVGTVTAVNYAMRSGWLGMLIVDPAWRRLGVATQLVERALAALAPCAGVGLDATPAGKGLYERMGFRETGTIVRYLVPACPAVSTPNSGVTPIETADLPAVAAIDAEAFGEARPGVISGLHALAPHLGWKLVRDGRIVAACLGRPGVNFQRVGPVLADSAQDADAMLRGALGRLHGQAVGVDVPGTQVEFAAALARQGFAEHCRFTRMYRGTPPVGCARRYQAILGGEFG